jgi:ABC-type glycerol-3-phosphate transport system substrate-binding protein
LRLGTLAAGATIITACTGVPQAPPAQQPAEQPAAEQGEGQAAAPTQEAVEVTAWAHWEQGLNWIDNALANYGFKDEHPNITMNKVVQPFAEVHDKMLAACASGVGQPDIMRVEQGRMSTFFKGEPCFVDLKDLIGDRIDDLILGSAVDYWSWQGAIYGIGNEMNACALAVRKSILDEIGVETPFETWQDLVEAGQILREEKDMAIISFHDLHDGDFQMMLFAAGGLMFDEEGNFGGATEIGREILAFQRDAIHTWKIADVAPVTGDATWAPPIYWESFRQNKIASTIGAPWHNGNLGTEDKIGPSQEGEWILQRLPGGFGENVPTATHGGTSVSIPGMAAHPEEAWMIMEFTHLTEAVLQDFEERGILVSYKPALQNEKYKEPWPYYGGQVIGDLYLELADFMPRIYQSPWAPEFHTAFQNLVLAPVLQGQADIDASFEALGPELERIKAL